MPITQQQLLQILPKASPVAGLFVPALNRAMLRWKIDSRLRQAAFIAQIGHESGQLRNLVENLSYARTAFDKLVRPQQSAAAGALWCRALPSWPVAPSDLRTRCMVGAWVTERKRRATAGASVVVG